MEMSCLTSSYFSSIDNGISPLAPSFTRPLTLQFRGSWLQFPVSALSVACPLRRSVHRGSERPARAPWPVPVRPPSAPERGGVSEVRARSPKARGPGLPAVRKWPRPARPPQYLDAPRAGEVRRLAGTPAGIAPAGGYRTPPDPPDLDPRGPQALEGPLPAFSCLPRSGLVQRA